MYQANGRRPRSITDRNLSRRELMRRSGMVGAGLAAAPLLSGMRALPVAAQDIPREPSSASVDGTLQVLLKDDFHPDHNEFMRAELEAFAEASGWDIEITDVAGYQGTGDLNQKLLGAVQSGNPPDLLIDNSGILQLHTLELIEPVTDLVSEVREELGDPIPGMRFDSVIDEEWWAVPFFTRVNGLWVRQDIFVEHGLDIIDDTETYDKLRDAALEVSNPDENMWGWGMTINRSGDGATLVQQVLFRFGSHVQDASGQIVTFNSQETIDGLNWLKETYSDEQWAPMLPPGVLSWTDANNNEAFLASQVATTQNAGTVYAKAVLDEVPFAGEIAYIPYPKRIDDDERLDFLSQGMKFFLINGARNKEAVYDTIRHFLSLPVRERVWSISTGYALPAYENGWENEIIAENPNSLRAKDIALNETDFNGLAWPGEDNAALAAIGAGVFFTDMMSEILQGRSTEEVVEDYHEQFVQIYQDFGREGE